MNRPNLIGSSNFKLSALYLGLFIVSFLTIGATVYWLTTHRLEQQLKQGIDEEISRLQSEFLSSGLSELITEVNEVESTDAHTLRKIGVLDQNGKLITGSLDHFRLASGWQNRRQTIVTKNSPIKTKNQLIHVVPLTHLLWLGVGHDTEYIEETGDAILRAFLWGGLMVLLLGGFGGFYISRTFLKKIDQITLSTQTIIAGDFRHRLPVTKNQDELDKLAHLINRMLDEMGTLIENVQQVTNDIAHDLRTPISRLKYNLEQTLKLNLSESQFKERIALGILEVDTILETFSALLRIAQIETNSRRSSFKQVYFTDVVTFVVDALLPVAEESGKTMYSTIQANCNLTGDKELLTQLVYNLIENAIRHTPEYTRIAISLTAVNDHQLELIVSDNGMGISTEYHQKVFQRFYRVEQSRAAFGNGLGLSIVAAIVSLHDGKLTLSDNQPGLKVDLLLQRS